MSSPWGYQNSLTSSDGMVEQALGGDRGCRLVSDKRAGGGLIMCGGSMNSSLAASAFRRLSASAKRSSAVDPVGSIRMSRDTVSLGETLDKGFSSVYGFRVVREVKP